MLIKALSAAAGYLIPDYIIESSLRFNDNDSAYLSRTPSVAGNRKTWTWSGWVKRGNLSGVRRGIFTKVDTGGGVYWGIEFGANDTIAIYDSNAGGSTGLITSAVFRDVSGWYHIAVAVDTTQATASDRVKLYVNGTQITSFSDTNYPPLNSDTMVNLAEQHSIGSWSPNSILYLFDGYMAEINFIDGQALTADDFGEINADTGKWRPKRYAGTYGTNGFHLPFDSNANDSSGNGNNWTENNLASTDYMIDTPNNSFAVLNSVTTITSLSEGNLKTTTTATGVWRSAVNTIGVSSGKWYFETCAPQALNNPPYVFIGITTNHNHGAISPNYLGLTADSWGLLNTGSKYNSGSAASYASSYTNGDVIGCALDMDAGTVEFFKNNVSQGVAFTGLTGTMFCGASVYAASGTTSNNINFGADSSFAGLKTRQGNTDANGIGDFYHTPPAGFLALCENNLPTSGVVASGGTETTILDGGRYYKVHTFTSSDTLTVSSGGEVEYLVVAGGAGGGSAAVYNEAAGGGGAGGYIDSSGTVLSGSYPVVIGAGGASASGYAAGGAGVDSTFNSNVAVGGGAGRVGGNGGSGGSGGGAGGDSSSRTGGSGTAGQGNNGGNSQGSFYGGGGGGGAGAVGVNGTFSGGGSGGAGLDWKSLGTYRAGGGGGSGSRQQGSGSGVGGLGGGGSASTYGAGTSGTANTGSGGGGSGTGPSGAGGSGIVIIRYTV